MIMTVSPRGLSRFASPSRLGQYALGRQEVSEYISVELTDSGRNIRLAGDWTVANGDELEEAIDSQGLKTLGQPTTIDVADIQRMDTLGAWLIIKLQRSLETRSQSVEVANLRPDMGALIERIRAPSKASAVRLARRNIILSLLEDVGLGTVKAITTLGELIGFLGLVFQKILSFVRRPHVIRLAPTVHQMELVGVRALPIVGLISFLIGAVIVNQGAIQLRQFGADIFVVDLLAPSILRELGVLLTAIIVAGRSGSAFTAQIGSMQLNEEVDAIKTIGMDPVEILVIPRVVALFFIMPVLTFYADMMGALGGGLMSWVQLDITPAVFVERFRDATFYTTFAVGIIKAPVFAVVIAIVGCFQGLSVTGSAESVGSHTTTSVVQSIVMVIVLDALFAVFFTAIDW